MNLKFRLHFLTFTRQTIVRLFLNYGQFHQPAVQILQCEALLVTVTFKCYVFLTGKQVSSYAFSVFLANGPSTVSFLIGYFNCVRCSYAHCS